MRIRLGGNAVPPFRPSAPPMRPQQTSTTGGPSTGTTPAAGQTGAPGGEPQFVNMLRQFLSNAVS